MIIQFVLTRCQIFCLLDLIKLSFQKLLLILFFNRTTLYSFWGINIKTSILYLRQKIPQFLLINNLPTFLLDEIYWVYLFFDWNHFNCIFYFQNTRIFFQMFDSKKFFNFQRVILEFDNFFNFILKDHWFNLECNTKLGNIQSHRIIQVLWKILKFDSTFLIKMKS